MNVRLIEKFLVKDRATNETRWWQYEFDVCGIDVHIQVPVDIAEERGQEESTKLAFRQAIAHLVFKE